MNYNKKNIDELSLNNKKEPEVRVFARLISRSQTKRVSGALQVPTNCGYTELYYDLVLDCQ